MSYGGYGGGDLEGERPDDYEPAVTDTQLARIRELHSKGRCPLRADTCGWVTCPLHGGQRSMADHLEAQHAVTSVPGSAVEQGHLHGALHDAGLADHSGEAR